jgi:hypothetical protein
MDRRTGRESRASLVLASVAVFAALAGTSYAMATRISGSSLKNRSLAGVKLKRHTLTGTEIDLKHFPRVPSARTAAFATDALQATNALHATTAATAGVRR